MCLEHHTHSTMCLGHHIHSAMFFRTIAFMLLHVCFRAPHSLYHIFRASRWCYCFRALHSLKRYYHSIALSHFCITCVIFNNFPSFSEFFNQSLSRLKIRLAVITLIIYMDLLSCLIFQLRVLSFPQMFELFLSFSDIRIFCGGKSSMLLSILQPHSLHCFTILPMKLSSKVTMLSYDLLEAGNNYYYNQ